jgi:hypothetical protein
LSRGDVGSVWLRGVMNVAEQVEQTRDGSLMYFVRISQSRKGTFVVFRAEKNKGSISPLRKIEFINREFFTIRIGYVALLY